MCWLGWLLVSCVLVSFSTAFPGFSRINWWIKQKINKNTFWNLFVVGRSFWFSGLFNKFGWHFRLCFYCCFHGVFIKFEWIFSHFFRFERDLSKISAILKYRRVCKDNYDLSLLSRANNGTKSCWFPIIEWTNSPIKLTLHQLLLSPLSKQWASLF